MNVEVGPGQALLPCGAGHVYRWRPYQVLSGHQLFIARYCTQLGGRPEPLPFHSLAHIC